MSHKTFAEVTDFSTGVTTVYQGKNPYGETGIILRFASGAPIEFPIRLNLGSGNRRERDGFVTLDMNPAHSPDIVARVPPIPLPDESVAEVFCSHLIEHLSNEDASELMREVYRVLVPGGAATFMCPYALSDAAFQDPTHKSFWTPSRFAYYTAAFAYLDYGLETRFLLEYCDRKAEEVTAVLVKPKAAT